MEIKNKFSLIPNYGDPNDPIIRAKYGYLEGVISIIGNTILFIIKLSLGLFINSIALIADSVHTLSDVGTSMVVIISFKISKRPCDKTHPYGYGRVEYIATIIIAILLIITAIEFIQQSIERLLNSIRITHEQYAFLIGFIVLLSAMIKEFMARFSLSIGKKINSDVITADAWHHRSDALASFGVGISIIGSSYGFHLLDPIFGLIMSIIIIYFGIILGKTSAHFLIGKSPDTALINRIQEIGHQIKEVKDIHDVLLHDYGTKKIITLHAKVDNNLSLEKAHTIADKLEQEINNIMHYSTIIHVEPTKYYRGRILKKRVIENILNRQKGVISFHNIHIIRRFEKDYISMHLIVNKDMNIQDSHKLCHKIEKTIKKIYKSCEVHIHLEPCESSNCSMCSISCDKKNSFL